MNSLSVMLVWKSVFWFNYCPVYLHQALFPLHYSRGENFSKAHHHRFYLYLLFLVPLNVSPMRAGVFSAFSATPHLSHPFLCSHHLDHLLLGGSHILPSNSPLAVPTFTSRVFTVCHCHHTYGNLVGRRFVSSLHYHICQGDSRAATGERSQLYMVVKVEQEEVMGWEQDIGGLGQDHIRDGQDEKAKWSKDT